MISDKKADLAGPGISTYDEVEKVLPDDYHSILTPRETMQAVFAAKRYIEDKRKTGSLLDVQHLTLSPAQDNEWFEYHVIVDGMRIVLKVNGVTVNSGCR